jgi:hypothetical protein
MYSVSGSPGSTATHRAPRPSSVSLTLPFSTTATALSPAAYKRVISEPPSRYVTHLSSRHEYATQPSPAQGQ